MADVAWVEICCDPRNLGSAAIPRRLGYRHVDTRIANTFTPTGLPRDTTVWRLGRNEPAGSDGSDRSVRSVRFRI